MPTRTLPPRRPAGTATMPKLGTPILAVVRALDPQSLNDLGGGEWTATVGACGLSRDDGSPSQDGDVLSVQTDGSLQTRAAGTGGDDGRLKRTAAGAVCGPLGESGTAVIIAVAADVPD